MLASWGGANKLQQSRGDALMVLKAESPKIKISAGPWSQEDPGMSLCSSPWHPEVAGKAPHCSSLCVLFMR